MSKTEGAKENGGRKNGGQENVRQENGGQENVRQENGNEWMSWFYFPVLHFPVRHFSVHFFGAADVRRVCRRVIISFASFIDAGPAVISLILPLAS
jgi:hypothetical protein